VTHGYIAFGAGKKVVGFGFEINPPPIAIDMRKVPALSRAEEVHWLPVRTYGSESGPHTVYFWYEPPQTNGSHK